MARYRINVNKSIAFLCNSKHTEKKIMDLFPFTIALKNNKATGNNPSQRHERLLFQNSKSLVKDIVKTVENKRTPMLTGC